MAIIGQGVQAGLGRVDYTPYLQGAMAGAQGIAQGISQVGKSAADAVQEYQKNKLANAALEGSNTRMLAIMESTPEFKQFAPNADVIEKYKGKLISGGLTLTDNKKLNAELNTALSVGKEVMGIRQQQAYAAQATAATNRMQYELDQTKRDRTLTDQFNTQLSQIPQGELTPERIFEVGVGLGAPANVVNTALAGRLDIGKFEISKKVNEANMAKDALEAQKLQLELARIRAANPSGEIQVIEKDGLKVAKFTDQSGNVKFEPINVKPTPPTNFDKLSSVVQQYQMGRSTQNPVLINSALAEYSKIMGFNNLGWNAEAVEEELVSRLINKIPNITPPPPGAAGIKSASRVSAGEKAPGTSPAPAPAGKPEAAVDTSTGRAVAQPNLPPQPPAPYTPPQQAAAAGNAGLNAWMATIGANRDPNAVANPRGDLASEYEANLVAMAPPPPVVDTNLFVPTTPARAPQYGEGRVLTAFGQVSPVAAFMERIGEVNPEVANRRLQMAAQMQGDGSYAAAGPFSRGGGVGGAIGRYLSGENLAGETARVLGSPFGAVPEQGNAPLPSQTTNLPSATLDAMAAPLESVPAARERMKREDALAKAERRRAEEERNRPAPPMKSAELPQITLSKDAKRIADLLLQEYENNKGGKAPTFTITASRPGGKETSIKLSDPAILAIMSNPTNFGGLIRGNAEQFSQQNARMNAILEEMQAARAARSRTVRGR